MNQEIYEWVLLLARWLHITVGITWIGTSIFFMWLDRTFEFNSDSKNKEYLQRHKNFVKYLRKLVTIREKNNFQLELEVLRDNIQNDNVSGKSWFLKKMSALVESL